MDELIRELKDEIIEALNLEEMTADDIDENEPLFGEGLPKGRRSSRMWPPSPTMSARTERNNHTSWEQV